MGEDKPFLPRGLIPGRGTAAHIRGRDPAATPAVLLYPKSRGRAPVFGEKGGRSDIKKSRTVKRMRTHLDRLAAKVSAVARGIAPHEGGRGEGRSAATLVRPRPQRQRIRSRPTKRRGRKKNRSKRKEKRSRRKERDIPRTSVGGASRRARADVARVGDRTARGRTRGRLAGCPPCAESHRQEVLFFMMLCRWRVAASLEREPGCCFLGISTIPTIRPFCFI